MVHLCVNVGARVVLAFSGLCIGRPDGDRKRTGVSVRLYSSSWCSPLPRRRSGRSGARMLPSGQGRASDGPMVPGGVMAERADVLVIGGGIVGLSTAWQLRQLGLDRVVVLEADTLGSGSTGRASGG